MVKYALVLLLCLSKLKCKSTERRLFKYSTCMLGVEVSNIVTKLFLRVTSHNTDTRRYVGKDFLFHLPSMALK